MSKKNSIRVPTGLVPVTGKQGAAATANAKPKERTLLDVPHITSKGLKNLEIGIDAESGRCFISFDPDYVYVGNVPEGKKTKEVGLHPISGQSCGHPMIASSGGFFDVDFKGGKVNGVRIGLNVMPRNREVIDHLAGIQRNLDDDTLLSMGIVPKN